MKLTIQLVCCLALASVAAQHWGVDTGVIPLEPEGAGANVMELLELSEQEIADPEEEHDHEDDHDGDDHDPEKTDQDAPNKKGSAELWKLKKAVAAAKAAYTKSRQTGNSTDAAMAAAAMAQVRQLTIHLETAIGQPQKGGTAVVKENGLVDPMAQVRVDTHPKSTEHEYPLLGITMNTAAGDGPDAPTSNTAEVWGSDISEERDAFQKAADKTLKGTFAEFGSLGKVLSKKGNGKGFGAIHTRPQEKDKTRPDAEKELDATVNDAEHLLEQSKQTLGIVTMAVNNVVKLTAADEKSKRLEIEARQREAHKDGGHLNGDIWDRIRNMNNNFKKQHELLEYATDSSGEAAMKARQNKEDEVEAETEENKAALEYVENESDEDKATDMRLEVIMQKNRENNRMENLKKAEIDTEAAHEEAKATEIEHEKMKAAESQLAVQHAGKAKVKEQTDKAEVEADQKRSKATEESDAEAQAAQSKSSNKQDELMNKKNDQKQSELDTAKEISGKDASEKKADETAADEDDEDRVSVNQAAELTNNVAKAKARAMSIAEQDAVQNANEDVESKVDEMEKKEANSLSEKTAEAEAEKATEQVAKMIAEQKEKNSVPETERISPEDEATANTDSDAERKAAAEKDVRERAAHRKAEAGEKLAAEKMAAEKAASEKEQEEAKDKAASDQVTLEKENIAKNAVEKAAKEKSTADKEKVAQDAPYVYEDDDEDAP